MGGRTLLLIRSCEALVDPSEERVANRGSTHGVLRVRGGSVAARLTTIRIRPATRVATAHTAVAAAATTNAKGADAFHADQAAPSANTSIRTAVQKMVKG
jgi:hypothetical protein